MPFGSRTRSQHHELLALKELLITCGDLILGQTLKLLRLAFDLHSRRDRERRHAGPGDSFLLLHALVNWYAREPRIVLADEPTGNLDGANAASVFALMLELNRERATSLVVVTHDLKLAQRMERIYELERGTLIARS
jgi:ABC-type cobalamin/Fe3+-siderophores transport system ATPase subunit